MNASNIGNAIAAIFPWAVMAALVLLWSGNL